MGRRWRRRVYDRTIRLWEAAGGQPLRTLEGHESGSVAWSPDGKTLASASYDRTIRLWEAASGQPLRTLEGHESEVLSVAWSPDAQRGLEPGWEDAGVGE
jgi:WD40 repeat protein